MNIVVRKFPLAAATAISFLFTHASAAAAPKLEYQVAPAGDDKSGDGSAQKPFATPARAATALAQRTAAERAQAAEVVLHAGTYFLRETLKLGAAQSGAPAAPVTWRAAGDGPVRFSGGVTIPASVVREVTNRNTLARLPARKDAGLRLYEIRLADLGLPKFPKLNARGMGRAALPAWPELYRRGAPLPLSSWPDGIGYGGGFKPLKIVSSAANGGKGAPGNSRPPMKFTVDPARAARWKSGMDSARASVWFGGHWYWDWADDFLPAASIDDQGLVTMALPSNYGIGKHVNLHIYNLAEEMNLAGEYALEPESGRILVLLEPGKTADLGLSWLETPAISLDRAVSVGFEKIGIGECRGVAVDIKGGEDIAFDRCDFARIGGTAIAVNSRLVRVRDCTFTCLGGAGVRLDGGDRATLARADNLVDHCRFEDFGRLWRTYAPGVSLSGVGNTVSNSMFLNAPHSAILYSGNEQTIISNEIHSVLEETGDCGAIYGGRDWTAAGTVIAKNWIHDLGGVAGRWACGIYLDDMISGIAVTGNWVDRAELGIMVGGGRNDIVTGNIFSNCKQAISADARGMGWGKERLTPTLIQRLNALPTDREPWKSRYPQVARTLSDRPNSPVGTKITDNAFVACQKSWLNRDDGGGAAILSPNFEKLPANSLIQKAREVAVTGTDLVFVKPEAGPRDESR